MGDDKTIFPNDYIFIITYENFIMFLCQIKKGIVKVIKVIPSKQIQKKV